MIVKATLTVLVDDETKTFQVAANTDGDALSGLMTAENITSAVSVQAQRWIADQETEIRDRLREQRIRRGVL